MKPIINDILASRYASQKMCEIWSPTGRIILERELWIAVMKAQKELGIDIPQDAIDAYEKVKNNVDLESINNREKELRHDVKSRIEEFCDLAGFEHIHKGMTSRDLTDNVEQLQILHSLKLIQEKYYSVLWSLKGKVKENSKLMLVARTHNVPAQPTTVGKRLAMFSEEMLLAFNQLDDVINSYPLRGIKGAVGTQLDQLSLLNGDKNAMKKLEDSIIKHLGFGKSLNNVGQVYPRSLDFNIVSNLYYLSSGISSLAKTIRLMAGQELCTEGFKKGQVGSSAMPHKMNTRSSERINGFHSIINGYLNMLMGISGDQWNEGDVSCSVVRRVALPGSFYAIDGQVETILTVLNEMGFYESVINKELEKYMPFVGSTAILMEAVKAGAGREEAHEAIKEHAVKVIEEMRFGDRTVNDLSKRLGEDSRIPISEEKIIDLLKEEENFIALANEQTESFVSEIENLSEKYPNRSYTPDDII